MLFVPPPVTARVSVVPFVAGAGRSDLALDRACTLRRLHDAGRPTGIVIGVAMVYALEVVLLTMLVC